MIGQQVWHRVFGQGIVILECDKYLQINFETFGTKNIVPDVWGTALFLSAEDYCNRSQEDIQIKYNPLRPVVGQCPAPKNDSATLEGGSGDIDLLFSEEDYLSDSVVTKVLSISETMLLDKFEGVMKRNIVLILCQAVMRGNKKLLRIVGIDVFSGKVVNIVDTNGREYGFHSCNNEFAKLKEQTVIQADFKMFENKFHLNTLRIVSPIRILGKGNVPKLKEKYEQLYPNKSYFIHSFDEVFKFCSNHKNSRSYFIVNFTGTQIQPHKDRYQLKMDKYFVDIRDVTFDYKRNGNKFYHGWTILQCDAGANGECRFSAQRLIGKFLTMEEFEKYMKDRKIRCYDDYSAYEDSDFIIDDSFEYDEEYEAYENECVEELAETYKEYAGDILDEYSEYAEDWDEGGYYGEDR